MPDVIFQLMFNKKAENEKIKCVYNGSSACGIV